MNVKINFIQDGDVTGVISVVDPNSSVDIYLGTGGGPEGVLAAAALKCLDGQMQTRLVLSDQEEINRAKKLGITDLNKKYNITDMIKGDVIFCATGVTDGDFLKGNYSIKESPLRPRLLFYIKAKIYLKSHKYNKKMNGSSVLGKDWISKNYNKETVNFLKDNFNLSEIVSKLIVIRNIKLDEVKLFFEPKNKKLLPNPFILKDMEKAVDRTINGIKKNEKIGVFGDYDVDGATSTAILGNYFSEIKSRC